MKAIDFRIEIVASLLRKLRDEKKIEELEWSTIFSLLDQVIAISEVLPNKIISNNLQE